MTYPKRATKLKQVKKAVKREESLECALSLISTDNLTTMQYKNIRSIARAIGRLIIPSLVKIQVGS